MTADTYTASDGTSWDLTQECPPIPARCFDWNAVEENHEGEPCHAFGETRAACILDIEQRVSERAEETA